MYVEIFCNRSEGMFRRYAVLGGLWVKGRPLSSPEKLVREFLEENSDILPLRWDRITYDNWETYRRFINLFFKITDLEYRCLILDLVATGTRRDQLKKEDFCGRLYFQLFLETLNPKFEYQIYLNQNAHPFRRELEVLIRCVNAYYKKNEHIQKNIVLSVKLLESEDSCLWTIVDLLNEIVQTQWEERISNSGQLLLADHVAHRLKWKDLHRISSHFNMLEQKFSIWKAHLRQSRKDQVHRMKQMNLEF